MGQTKRTQGDGLHTDYTEEHPSYGMLRFSRISGGNSPLFGTSIRHNQAVLVELHKAVRVRNLHNDHYHDRELIVEAWMSPAQFAEAITTLNYGNGIPVTLRWVDGKQIPLPEFHDIKQEFRDEFKQRTDELSTQLAGIVKDFEAVINAGSIPKSKAKEILSQMKNAVMQIQSNLPFTADQFGEQMEKTVAIAKAEVDAVVQHAVTSVGLKAIAEQMPQLPMADGK